MKILRITDTGYEAGGVENGIVLLQPLLTERGHTVRTLASGARQDLDHFNDYSYQPLGRYNKLFYSFNYYAYSALKLALEDFQPDVVHIHTIGEASPAILFPLKNYPVVLTVHGPEDYSRNLLLWCFPVSNFKHGRRDKSDLTVVGKMRYLYHGLIHSPLYKIGFRNVDIIITLSNYMHRLIEQEGRPNRYIPNGTVLFDHAPQKDAPSNTLAYVGRLEKVKGVDYLIKALAKVRKKFPDTRLLIAGDGSEKTALEKLTIDLHLEHSVEFLGQLKRQQLEQLYQQSALVVMPSAYPEAFGKVGIEAMSVGRPVVATDVGGISDWLTDGKTGLLVPAKDPTALANAVSKLLSNHDLLSKMGQDARKKAEEFDLDKHAEQMEKIYIEVINSYPKKYMKTEYKILPLKTLRSRIWLHFKSNSLFRNSIYLMLATAVMAGFGFFFWLINARIFSAHNIGLATALISVMNIIAVLSLIGFDAAFVRFLPNSKRRNQEMNAGFILVGMVALALGAFFILFVPAISPELVFVRANPLMAFMFTLFCVMSALNILTDAVFLAYRETKYTFIINGVFSALKMLLPFLFIPWGALGIFAAAAVAQSLGFCLSVAVLIYKFDYRPSFLIDSEVLHYIRKYCTGNYIAGIFSFIPVMLLPILITNQLGPQQAAYYYIVMMIGNLLYTIPQAVTRSLFAEGSFDEQSLHENIRRSVRFISWLMLPTIAVLILGGSDILNIFGAEYSSGGTPFLYLVAITALVLSIYYIFFSLFRVIRDLKSLIIVNALYAGAVIGFSIYLMPYGLLGIGTAWLLGNMIAAASSYILYRWDIDQKHSHRTEKDTFLSRFDALIYDLNTIFSMKFCYFFAWAKRGFKKQTILFYPAKPDIFHIIYKICHVLGIKITNDPETPVDAIIAFEDTTIRNNQNKLDELARDNLVFNIKCADISKENVEKIFHEVFGYGTFVDPVSYHGLCVKKSSQNATHDGKVIQCPAQPETGYIYQKLISNLEGGQALDLRVPIFKDRIPPFVLLRYKNDNDRFDNTHTAVIADLHTKFSPEEIDKIIEFSRRLGLDYGELDILRDNEDGRIYIVDANNTPAGPCPARHISRKDYWKLLKKMTQAFAAEFLPGDKRQANF